MGDHRGGGDTTRKGYGAGHQRLRAQWAPVVAAGGVRCHRDVCGELIEPGTPWDLGHVDGDKTRYSGPEHQRCNRRAGAQQRNSAPRDPAPRIVPWW